MTYEVLILSKDKNTGTISSEDVSLKVPQGFSFLEKLDDSLDIGKITIRGLTTSTPYTLFDTVQLKIDGNLVYSLRISSDTVQLISKRPKLYEHVLTLVEHTKIAELFVVSGKTFTQPTDGTVRYHLYDVLQDLIDTTPYELNSLYSSNRVVKLPTSGDLYDFLTTTPSPEYTFKDLTLRECFIQVGDYFDGIPRLFYNSSNELELTFDIVGELELKNLITSTDDFITQQVSQEAQFYATQIESEALNLVSDETIGESVEIYPSRNTYINFRRVDDFFQADFTDSVLPTPKEISRVIALNYYAPLEITNATQSRSIYNGVREWRITSGIFEEKAYNQLGIATSFPTDANAQISYKNNSIFYKYKEKNVTIGTLYGLWGTSDALGQWLRKGIIEIAVAEGLIDGTTDLYSDDYTIILDGSGGFDVSIEESIFNVEYIPIPNSMRLNIERQDINDVSRQSKLLLNQQNRIVNLESFANNLQGKVNRIGNSDLELANRVTSFTSTDIYDVGDYTDELYIVTQKEAIFFRDYIFYKYGLTKNFNKISSFIGVNSEIRQWEIGERNTLERNMVYKEFIEIDAKAFGSGSNNSEILTSDGIECYLDTFNTSSTYEAVSIGAINPSDVTNRSIVGLSSNGGGNSLIFSFKAEDNIAVGYYKATSSGQTVREYSAYADNEGITDKLEVIAMEKMAIVPIASVQDVATDYPKISTISGDTDWEDRLGTIYLRGNYKIKKDSREIIGQTTQLAQLSKDTNKVVLGRYFSIRNRLVSESPPVQLRLYTYDTITYGRGDNLNLKSGWATQDLVTPTIDTVNNTVRISSSNLNSNISSWALTDENNKLLLAVNQEGQLLNLLTFDFNNKRSGINYKY